MNKKILLLAFVSLLFIPIASANDITISVDQSTYYFLTGQQAIIPLDVNNTYGKQINGKLKYTITQEVNQGGYHYSSSNTQSTLLNANEGNNTVNLNFGTSDTPITLKVGMVFSYEQKDQREVTLNDIAIYFVSNQSQMKNEKNGKESSSQKVVNNNQNQQNQQQQQNSQQKLQNNQLSQDSSALKQQLQKQLQQQQQQKEKFEQNLFNNSEFQEHHQDILQKGYNVSSTELNPTDNNSGDFKINYQNEKGEKATLEGEMNGGKMDEIQQQTAEDRRQMLESLNQSKQFQEFKEQLEHDGYNQTDIEFTQDGNETQVNVNYQDENNQTATINAEFENGMLKSVELKKENQISPLIWILLPVVLIASFIIYILYKKYVNKVTAIRNKTLMVKEKPFDYISEANELLEEAKKLYDERKYTDAYGKAGQSLRLFLSYNNGLNRELTNDDVVKYLRRKNKSYKKIKECFDLCNLVEFAKYHVNRKDFDKIINTTRKTIG